ncbi:MAG TPA: hypothetical protein VND62_00070 [Acidimicrobiales bacterium]|nr:hypothetical protein [Acidimicrobiales bacterium]
MVLLGGGLLIIALILGLSLFWALGILLLFVVLVLAMSDHHWPQLLLPQSSGTEQTANVESRGPTDAGPEDNNKSRSTLLTNTINRPAKETHHGHQGQGQEQDPRSQGQAQGEGR